MAPPEKVLYTIGHSNHPLDRFLELLKRHGIEVVVDVRSRPYSKYTPHFSKDAIEGHLQRVGLKYLFLGRELGGQPDDEQYYDEAGHVLYWKLAQSPAFRDGLERLKQGSRKYRVALMCGEEDPSLCHRRLLIARVLFEQGIPLEHIRGDGELESEEALRGRENAQRIEQGDMFTDPADAEQSQWKSTQSGLRRNPQANSSDF